MKSFITLSLFTLSSILCNAQTDFCNGWKKGYKEGYCYQQYNCVVRVVPLCPLPKLGEKTYNDGYNRGFIVGREKREEENTSTYEVYNETNVIEESTNTKSTNPYRQNSSTFKELRLDQFLTIKGLSMDVAIEYLVNNYWLLDKVVKEENKVVFTNLEGGKLGQTMMLYHNSEKIIENVTVITFSSIKSNEYLKAIQDRGAKYFKEIKDNGEIVTIYKSTSEVYQVIKKSDPNSTLQAFIFSF